MFLAPVEAVVLRGSIAAACISTPIRFDLEITMFLVTGTPARTLNSAAICLVGMFASQCVRSASLNWIVQMLFFMGFPF